MNMNVNIVMDGSGSMSENGKVSIMKYIINSAKGYSKEEGTITLSLYQWGDKIECLNDLAEFRIQDVNSEGDIAEFVNKHTGEKILILSDGGFSIKTKKAVRGMQGKENVFCIGVGCDCNFPAIRSLIDDKNIFRPQDIITCLQAMSYTER